MKSINEEKSSLRKVYRERRNAICVEDRTRKSRIIAEKLLDKKELKSAKLVFVYVSVKSEADTRYIISRLLKCGKRVAVPVCAEDGGMEAYPIENLDGLLPNRFGIPEPDCTTQAIKPVAKNDIDIIVVPALAFDRNGYRLGYGGGYYDRYLQGFSGYTIGIEFSDCMAEGLPALPTDVKVDTVITDDAEYKEKL